METAKQIGRWLDSTHYTSLFLQYILTEREAKLKTKIWMEINADYLKEMKEKEEREAKLKEEQKDKPEKKVT